MSRGGGAEVSFDLWFVMVQASRTPIDGDSASLSRDSIELFLIFTFGHEVKVGAGCPNEPSDGKKRCDNRGVNEVNGAMEVEHDIHVARLGNS